MRSVHIAGTLAPGCLAARAGQALHVPLPWLPETRPALAGGIAERAITAKVLPPGVPVLTACQEVRSVAVPALTGPLFSRSGLGTGRAGGRRAGPAAA